MRFKAPVSVATAVGLLLTGGSALAQIDEIVVTTQKREQSVQDIPISVTALSAEDLTRGGIEDISRLDLVTPGLQFGFSGADARVNIRGVRTESVNERTDLPIAFFVDGIYKSRNSQALGAFVDVERVEVQRGPQGTLNGRNAYGGAIAVFTNKPEDEFDAGIRATVGNFGRLQTNGFVNIPLSDTFQLRLAGQYERTDGYVEAFVPGQQGTSAGNPSESAQAINMGALDDRFARLSLAWQPTDSLDFLLRLEYLKQEGTALGDFGYQVLGTLAEANPAAPPVRQTDLNGVFVPGNVRRGSGGATPDRGPYDIAGRDIAPVRDNEGRFFNLDINWDLGPVALRSITGYNDWKTFREQDGDYSPQRHFYVRIVEPKVDTFTQEIQLLSNNDGPLEWVAGLFYLDDQVENENFFWRFIGIEGGDPASTGNCGNDDRTVACAPTGVPANAGAFNPFARLGVVDTKSIAVFGDITWNITDNLRVFGGARWTEDDKSFKRFNLAQPDPANPPDGFLNIKQEVQSESAKFDETTWRAGVQLDFNDDVMSYFQASTGFTAGGFNTSGPDDLRAFDPQKITAYELGLKSTLAEGRVLLNAALYRNEQEDVLTQAFDPVGGTVQSFFVNGGEVETTGFEAEVNSEPVDNLRITGAFAYQKAEYGEFFAQNPFELGDDPGISGVNINGDQVALTPEITFNVGASYAIETANAGTFTPFLQFSFTDSYTTNDLKQLPNQDSFTKTDLRLFWESESAQWTGEIFVENIEDEAVLVRTVVGSDFAIFGTYLPPRTYGARIGYRFR